jgi:hypothetical protein
MSLDTLDPPTRAVLDPPTVPRNTLFHRLVRTAFSFPVFLCSGLILLAALTVRGRFDDPDLWLHLKFGQIIWARHFVPTTDLFSYTAANNFYIPHEWLAQLTIFGAYQLAGYPGLMLWLLGSTSVLLISLYGLCSLYSGNVKVSFLGGIIGWYFATISLAIRPLLIGHILMIVELVLLHLGRTHDRRWFYGLPPLFALWVNCHGSFAFGLLILATVLACAFFTLNIGPIVSTALPLHARRALAAAVFASLVALFCNPVGWKLITYPLKFMFVQDVGLSLVQEWLPLPFFDERSPGLLLILAGVAMAAAARRIEIRLEELILIAIAAILSLQHRRMLFLFGILAAPVVCRLLAGCWDRYDRDRDWPLGNSLCMAVAAFFVVLSFPTQSELGAQVAKASPVAAVEFIHKARLRGPMLNDYWLGNYLMWALPEHKVFVDGRSDVFDWNGVLEAFRRWAYLEEDPQLLLDKYHVGFCILGSQSPLVHVIPHLRGWNKVYGDSVASVFVLAER